MKNRLVLGLLVAVAACTDTTSPDPKIDAPSNFGSDWKGKRLPAPTFDYVFTNLTPLVFGTAEAIDASGFYITGRTQDGHAYISCGCVGIIQLQDMGSSRAFDVSYQGNVVGSFLSGGSEQPAYWRFGGIFPLPMPAGHVNGAALGITPGRAFTAVGYTEDAGGVRHAVRWDVNEFNGVTLIELDDNGFGSEARGVNLYSGLIVGSIKDAGDADQVARWALADNALTDMLFAGVGLDVNARGMLVATDAINGIGFVSTAPGTRTVWDAGALVDTEALGINDGGLVAGAIIDGANSAPAIWDTALNETFGVGPTGPGVSKANDISNGNLVVGSATVSFGSFGWTVFADRDADDDGVSDFEDNCAFQPNADQADADGNFIGDVCDPTTPPTFTPIVIDDTRHTGADFVLKVINLVNPGNLPLTFTWIFPDGTTANGRNVRKAFATGGDKVVTLEITNGISSASEQLTLHVTSGTPSLSIFNSPATATSGRPVGIDVEVFYPTDPGAVTLSINWGDGVIENINCEVVPTVLPECTATYSHTYLKPATRGIRVSATTTGYAVKRASVSMQVDPIFVELFTESAGGVDHVDSTDPNLAVTVLGGGCSCFDVREIRRNTIRLSAGGTPQGILSQGATFDQDGDLRKDRVFNFDMTTLMANGNFASSPATILITGRTTTGAYFQGVRGNITVD